MWMSGVFWFVLQILAEDLVYQLSMLEKSTNPYYNKDSFIVRIASTTFYS